MLLALVALILWGSGLLSGGAAPTSSAPLQNSSQSVSQGVQDESTTGGVSSQPESSSTAKTVLSGDDVWLLRLVNHDNPLPDEMSALLSDTNYKMKNGSLPGDNLPS